MKEVYDMVRLRPSSQMYRPMLNSSIMQNVQSAVAIANAQDAKINICVKVANLTEGTEIWQSRKMEEMRKV